MSPLIYTVDANALELFSRADSRLRTLDRALGPSEAVLAEKVRVLFTFRIVIWARVESTFSTACDCLVLVKWTVGQIYDKALLVLERGDVLTGGNGRIGFRSTVSTVKAAKGIASAFTKSGETVLVRAPRAP